VDGFVLNCVATKSDASLCELLRKRYPRKKIFAVMDNGERGPSSADYVIPTGDPLPLLAAVKECFGKPRLQ
jgi:hypothetical protein